MDRERFDQITRALASTVTRRRVGGLLVALGAGSTAGLGLFGSATTDARRAKRKKRKRNKHRDKPTACQPDCVGKECGPDGCGGSCGPCEGGAVCDLMTGQCVAICYCPQNHVCDDQGGCVCVPDCAGKTCGPDGCGGTCGTCSLPFHCQGGVCKVLPI